ncbi:ACP phosphodiesterase [Vibrio mexicanus]|uniref:acyl carrier protein phosphodiesterase n=1 Tax=Vibrio mexicanus TaxID=1004326 RepID=UPI00063C7683|nr:ACP phosphodiesterase [Vibrio mexicanus]
MNFLAHLHIANHCDSDLQGNLLGDFVKGDPSKQYEERLVKGIKLHRFVDSYTDTHAVMKETKSLFPKGVRRFSPIAMDMFWDHCLAANWERYHDESLRSFCDFAEAQARQHSEFPLPSRYLNLMSIMWDQRWLESYQHLDNIEYALIRMSSRSPRMSELKNCFEHIENNYHQLLERFELLYPDVLAAAKAQSF